MGSICPWERHCTYPYSQAVREAPEALKAKKKREEHDGIATVVW